jgi:Cu2+-exporting ATPase
MTSASPIALDAPLDLLDDPVEQGLWTRRVTGAAGESLAESSLQLAGLHCAACAGIIEQALARVPGVHAAQVHAAAERATVRWDPARTQASALIVAVRAAGYSAVPDAAAPARALRRQEHRQALWRLFVAAFCAMQVMMMATPSYVAGPGELAPDLRQLLNWGSWLLSLPVLAFSAAPFFSGAWHALRQRRIGMDVPVALGVLITFGASMGATFSPGGVFGHEVYFDSLTMFVSFLLAARYLELLARQRAAEALETSLARLPESAWRVADDGSVQAVSVHRLRAGDLLRVPVGQAFAADGEVEQGSTRADESLLSGESLPVPKAVGDSVVAGSLNLASPVQVRVRRVGGDTRQAAIEAMMRGAVGQRPAAARLADRWAGPFLWAVLLLAAGAAAVWSTIDPARALWVAVSVLVVTCPCALSLAAPATLVAAVRGLARRGVLVQRLESLEGLARIDQVFFDKTGTLTEDAVSEVGVRLTPAGLAALGDDGQARAVASQLASQLAAWSSHPLSRALARPGPAGAWSNVHETSGQGLAAVDAQGRSWRLGSAAWAGANTGVNTRINGGAGAAAEAQVWLACEGQAMAAFTVAEALRPGAVEAVQALRAAGLQVTLLTGDAAARAQALAARLGITDVRAAATPEAKLEAIAQAQAAGRRVAMVGDGINDAPVLARADVSLAMGQGALLARCQADAVITSNRLTDLVRARQSAMRALAIVRQNLVWAAAYNALAVPLALAGWLPPWAAGLGMAGSSLVVVLNALRASR